MSVMDKMFKFVQVMKPGQKWMRLINGELNNNFTSTCKILHDYADWERGGKVTS